MATLHLMVGLPCSGKTTLAKKLEQDLGAVRFTPDAWQLQLFGQDAEHPDHDERHSKIEALQWQLARQLLTKNIDVILDFGLWTRLERDNLKTKAAALGVRTKLHYLDVPLEVLFDRLGKRNKHLGTESFYIPRDMFKQWLPLFEPPDDDEFF